MNDKAHILFVDDEKRVLNSMRGLLRRDFELFLTTDGSDAVRIAAENSIDVIVADQRMPGMTGIEVLGKVKEISPRTVRILLTGYADPEAVEGSINIGEVFRFLSKPCPPQLLRETLLLAVTASQSAIVAKTEKPPVVAETTVPEAASEAGSDAKSPDWRGATNIVMSGDMSQEVQASDTGSRSKPGVKNVGIVFFTVDSEFAETAMRAAGDRSVTLATTLVKVAHTIERKEAGILVTDFTTNNAILQRMISTLKQHLPELVTIVVSNSRDTTDMIGLINHGQVFRFVVKPIEPSVLMSEIDAAAAKHLALVNNPNSIIRHQVVDMADQSDAPKELNSFVSRIRKLRVGQTVS